MPREPEVITIELVLALLFVLVLIAAAARFTRAPWPLAFIAGGIALSFMPAFGRVHLDPGVFFVLFIPPLLYADGWRMPRREFSEVGRPVLLLAFGLVFATVVLVGYTMHLLIPSLPLAAAFALGAIVSPTDAVATAAMTARLPLPSRVTHILNGESLINDASGLVAFKFAVAAAATGVFSIADAGVELVRLALGGAVAGLAVAWAIGKLHDAIGRLAIGDPTIHAVLSLLTPFAAYLFAEQLGVSGILAVVTSGVYGGWRDGRSMQAATRQHTWEVWRMLLFVFNGFVFVLLGVTLPAATLSLARTESPVTLALYAVALWLILMLVRFGWVYLSARIPLPSVRRTRDPRRSSPNRIIIGWAGLRGAVTMAAALSLPVKTAAGAPFPGRDLVIFLAAATIVLTLVVNGLTLPWLVRMLGLRGDGRAERERRDAESVLAQAAVAVLERELPSLAPGDETIVATRLIADYNTRAAHFAAPDDRREEFERVAAVHRRLQRLALDAERRELEGMLDRGAINDETKRQIEERIDHAELMTGEGTRT